MARQIENLNVAIAEKNTQIREARAEVQRHVPNGVTLGDFLGLAEDLNVDAKLTAKQQELAAIRQADSIRGRAVFQTVALPDLPDEFNAILAKTLEGVADDAQRRIVEHITAHGMGDDGETWVSQGVPHIDNESCPFCGQDLRGVDLITAYRAYFSDAYDALRDEIAEVAVGIETALSDVAIAALERIIEQNANCHEFWKNYCTFEIPQLDAATDIDAILRSLRTAALALLERKSAAPLEVVVNDEAMLAALQAFTLLGGGTDAYNTAAEAANIVIRDKKQQTGEANPADVEAELTTLSAQKIRHEIEINQGCEAYQVRQVEKSELEAQKNAMREQLDAHTEQVIDLYGITINRYLDRINAGFHITTPDHTYRGGTPSSSYQIVINETEVSLGDAETPLDQPSFKNTLSSGDRSTLSDVSAYGTDL